jgi:RNA polymerase sigma-70 factor (TIGR02960 family)
MPVQSLLVESVDLRRLGGSTFGSDVLSYRFDRRQVPPGEEKRGPFARKRTRNRPADRTTASVNHGVLVLKQHRLSPFILANCSKEIGSSPKRGPTPFCQSLTNADTATAQNWAPSSPWLLMSTPVVRQGIGEVARWSVMATDLIARARSGDGDAFRELTEPHRPELQVHCYRMLGSFQDAEDALQETLLAAWQGFGGFEERASLRTWLYRIATNRCLNALRRARRRPAIAWPMPDVEPPEPTRSAEVTWLEPFPEKLFEGSIDVPLGPEARYEQTEAISLAFVTALQALPGRQLAVLILRDVLGFHAYEVADMLASTVESVNSALKRAGASLQRRLPPAGEREPPPAPDSPAERALVERFVRAYQAGNIDALVALLTTDILLSMPPFALEYQGCEIVARLYEGILGSGRSFELVPARANGQPAFGAYLRSPTGVSQGTGIIVLTLTGDRICGITRFDESVLPSFELPRLLTD